MSYLSNTSYGRAFRLSLILFGAWTVVYALFAYLLSKSVFMTAEVLGMIQLQLFGAWAFIAGLAGLFYLLHKRQQQGRTSGP